VLAFLGGACGCLLAFAAAASLVTGLLFGLGPALRSARTDLNPLLKGNSGVTLSAACGRKPAHPARRHVRCLRQHAQL